MTIIPSAKDREIARSVWLEAYENDNTGEDEIERWALTLAKRAEEEREAVIKILTSYELDTEMRAYGKAFAELIKDRSNDQ